MPIPLELLRQNLGPRILKTGLAVFVTLLLSQWVAPQYGVYAGLAAFLAVQPSLVRSRNTIRQQLIGNFIGAVLGAAIAYTLGHGPLAMSAGVVALLVLLRWLHLPESINLAVVMLLFVLDRPEGEFLGFGVSRIGAVFFGTITGYLVNRFVAPPDYRGLVYRHLSAAGDRVDGLLELVRRHLAAPAGVGKATIKAAAAAAAAELDLTRNYLRLEEEDEAPMAEAVHKGINSIGVFTERLMDTHKVLLLAEPLDDAALAAVDGALAAICAARRAVYRRLAQIEAAGRAAGAANRAATPPGDDVLAPVRAALGGLADLVEQRVASAADRAAGLALHGVLTNLRHMSWRLESMERLLATPAGGKTRPT